MENEPGFENTTKENNNNYNGCVRYENCRVAVLYQNQHLTEKFAHFQQVIDEYYIKHYQEIRDLWRVYKKDYNHDFFSQTYSLEVKADYDKMLKGLAAMYKSLSLKYPELAAEHKVVEDVETSPRPLETTCATEVVKKKKKIKIIKK